MEIRGASRGADNPRKTISKTSNADVKEALKDVQWSFCNCEVFATAALAA